MPGEFGDLKFQPLVDYIDELLRNAYQVVGRDVSRANQGSLGAFFVITEKEVETVGRWLLEI